MDKRSRPRLPRNEGFREADHEVRGTGPGSLMEMTNASFERRVSRSRIQALLAVSSAFRRGSGKRDESFVQRTRPETPPGRIVSRHRALAARPPCFLGRACVRSSARISRGVSAHRRRGVDPRFPERRSPKASDHENSTNVRAPRTRTVRSTATTVRYAGGAGSSH